MGWAGRRWAVERWAAEHIALAMGVGDCESGAAVPGPQTGGFVTSESAELHIVGTKV
jgi:hypothetical protein